MDHGIVLLRKYKGIWIVVFLLFLNVLFIVAVGVVIQ